MAFLMEWDWVRRVWDHVEARCGRSGARVARRPIWAAPTALSDLGAPDRRVRYGRRRPVSPPATGFAAGDRSGCSLRS
jgi:hypothetical protein